MVTLSIHITLYNMNATNYSGFDSIAFGPMPTIESEGTITLEVTDSHIISTNTKLVGAEVYQVMDKVTGESEGFASYQGCASYIKEVTGKILTTLEDDAYMQAQTEAYEMAA